MEATSACASACVSATSAHSLLLLQQLNVQREFGFLCDCTVAIGNVYFKAHRAVLAAFSNYFKMIFIHQTSECIKIQPTDIQPDVFSYLLHVMYTGACPKQAVEPARLEDGIKFLHAHQLCRKSGDGLAGGTGQDAAAPSAADAVRMSNLYGIQISSQLAGKEAPATVVHTGARGGRTHSHPSLAVGSEGERSDGQASSPQDDFDISAAIKQERPEDEGAEMGSPPQDGAASEERRRPPPPLACPRCGHCCPSPERLRQHLFSHALHPALFTEGLAHEGGGGLDDEDEVDGQCMDAGRLEEALRQSRALAAQLAAELRRSREGAGLSAAPAAAHSRKRKMACAVCGVRFSHKSQLQEHMYAHTAKPPRLHRHSQLFHSSAHFCHEGGGALANDTLLDVGRDAHDNGSSAYSLDSEISQESGDGGRCE